MSMPELCFEDFPVGETLKFGNYLVTRDEIIAYAKSFDPQPAHLDEAAAEKTVLGGLSASGWQIGAILMSMMCDEFMLRSSSLGAPGIEEIKWLRPVRPGDRLSATRRCKSARVSNSRPEMGICVFDYTVENQTGETVSTFNVTQLFGRRASMADAP